MMNTKHLAEYIIENFHEDADAKIMAQAYLDLLKEMEGKVLVPVDFIKNVSQLINYIDEEGPTAKAWEPITEICESIKAMIAARVDEDFDYSTLRRKK